MLYTRFHLAYQGGYIPGPIFRAKGGDYLGHWSAVDGPSLAITPGADVWVSHQSITDAAAPLVDPQFALQALYGVVANTTAAGSMGTCLISGGYDYQGQHQRPGTWSSS